MSKEKFIPNPGDSGKGRVPSAPPPNPSRPEPGKHSYVPSSPPPNPKPPAPSTPKK